LDAVILSHYHADHVADLGCLQYAARIDLDLGRRKKPLVVYGHQESPGFAKTRYLDFVEGVAFDKASSVRIGPFTFTFAPMVHPDPSYAIRAECGDSSLVYSGDTGMTPTLATFAKGTNLLVCETSLYNEYRGRIKGHLSAGEAGEQAKAAGVGTLLATHLPHFGVHADLLSQASAAFGGPTLLAHANLELDL
jgi:ribonuclease BN (tRNA processing enzyme)